MISIAGLTAKQKILMDVLWSMEDINNVNAFVNSLPTQDKLDCRSMMQIALWESLEHDGVLDVYTQDAQAVIAAASS